MLPLKSPKGKRIHKELIFPEPIRALDQDRGARAAVRYELVAGDSRRLFALDPRNGTLFLEKEIDLDSELGLPGEYSFIVILEKLNLIVGD